MVVFRVCDRAWDFSNPSHLSCSGLRVQDFGFLSGLGFKVV